MTEDELVRVAEEKGWTDGAQLAAYSPPVAWRVCDDVDDAYRSAYWHAVAYVQPWARDFPH